MADQLKSVPTVNGATSNGAVSLEERKGRLTKILAEKVDQGFAVESRTDTQAVLTTQGRKRWFGLRGRTPGTRRKVSVDEQGRTSTHKMSQ